MAPSALLLTLTASQPSCPKAFSSGTNFLIAAHKRHILYDLIFPFFTHIDILDYFLADGNLLLPPSSNRVVTRIPIW